MKYTFICQPDGAVLSVEANDDKEAVQKLTVVGKKHMEDFHPDASSMTDAEWETYLRKEWKKQD